MSQKIVNILCEGQTEDRFAQHVLKPYLKAFGIVVKTQLLVTNKKKNIRGGMISYQRANMDLTLWIKQHSKITYEEHYYTTMFDLYKLPDDFPGYEEAHKTADCYVIVKKLEEAFGAKHHYDKPKSGELVTGKVGIPLLKAKCQHFREWIESLENIAADKV